ncbi:glycosyltransferase family 2 protein [Yeosuana marina]|uniref:glycosyltransferase family 2 protein n=1 Tax=Yeosuana marina TaxID=1565536 RepID=UPI0014222C9A|nr:glycosyltransferase [Yeosuana marina]
MKDSNLISIILPVHNGQAFLEDVIASIFSQSYSNFELIIVNDCSNDNSLSIAEKFAKKDDRIIIVSNNDNKKLPSSLNIGHKQAKGEFITWTSDDNILKPNFLEKLIDSLLKNQVDVVYSNYDVINEKGSLKRIHTTGPIEHILYGNKIGASFLYKKEVFQELNGYDESLFLLEDYDFWLRASIKFNFHHLEENLYQYRLHTDSLTSNIQYNGEEKIKHRQGVITMFKKNADEFSWNNNTLNLLLDSFLGEKIDISKYLNEKKVIKKDLLKFNSKGFDDTKVIFGLQLLLRNQLMTNNCDFKSLIEVLKKERQLLFHSSFSKKTTINYILKSVFL